MTDDPRITSTVTDEMVEAFMVKCFGGSLPREKNRVVIALEAALALAPLRQPVAGDAVEAAWNTLNALWGVHGTVPWGDGLKTIIPDVIAAADRARGFVGTAGVEWQPIETALKDETTIFGQSDKTGQRGIIHWNGSEWEMVNGLTNLPMGVGFYPSHWHHLLPPPAWATQSPERQTMTEAKPGRYKGAGPWPDGQYFVWDIKYSSIRNPDDGSYKTPYRQLNTLAEAQDAAEALNKNRQSPERRSDSAPRDAASDAATHDPNSALEQILHELRLVGKPGKVDSEVSDSEIITLSMGWIRNLRRMAGSKRHNPGVAALAKFFDGWVNGTQIDNIQNAINCGLIVDETLEPTSLGNAALALALGAAGPHPIGKSGIEDRYEGRFLTDLEMIEKAIDPGVAALTGGAEMVGSYAPDPWGGKTSLIDRLAYALRIMQSEARDRHFGLKFTDDILAEYDRVNANEPPPFPDPPAADQPLLRALTYAVADLLQTRGAVDDIHRERHLLHLVTQTFGDVETPSFPPWSREMACLVRFLADRMSQHADAPENWWTYDERNEYRAIKSAAFPDTPDGH